MKNDDRNTGSARARGSERREGTADTDRIEPPSPPLDGGSGDGTTGRYIVLLREGASEEAVSALHNATGARLATTAERGVESDADAPGADGVVFHEIDAAVVAMDPSQLQALQLRATESTGDGLVVEAVEPERYVYALQELGVAPRGRAMPAYSSESDAARLAELVGGDGAAVLSDSSAQYLLGYRDSINALVDTLLARGGGAAAVAPAAPGVLAWNETLNTWGLQATRVIYSTRSGRGVRVAVLDTGIAPNHPDFAGRSITKASFVTGQTPDDGHGHGTHCIGTACGPRTPRVAPRPRYGIAYESEIFAGKVLSNAGSGADGGILAGINWAVANRCAVISMSLGAVVSPNTPFNQVYEGVAQRALVRGSLIVAAAGNNGPNAAVNQPANCPSIMAVAAVDETLRPAPFSCRGLNPNGGAVDIAGPGVNVYSTWPPAAYRRLNGTSMATPHVAGIAALYAQATGARGHALWRLLVAHARRLPSFPPRDVGAGLVQAQ